MRKLFYLIFFLLLTNLSLAQTLTSVALPDFGRALYWHHNDTLSIVSTNAGNLYARHRHSAQWMRVPENFSVIHGISLVGTDFIVVGVTPNNEGASGIMHTADFGATWNQLKPMSIFGSQNGVGYTQFRSTLNEFFYTWGFGDVKRYNYSSNVITTLTNTTTDNVGTYRLEIIGSHIYRYITNTISNFFGYTNYRGNFSGSLSSMYSIPGTCQNLTYSDGNYQMILDRTTQQLYTKGPGIPGPHSVYNISTGSSNSDYHVICRNGTFYVTMRSGSDIYFYYSSNGVNFSSALNNDNVPDFKPVEILPDGRLVISSATLLVYDPQTQKLSTFDNGIKEAVVSDVHMNDYGDIILNCQNITYTKLFDESVYTPHLNTPNLGSLNKVHVSNSRIFYAFANNYSLYRKTLTDNEFNYLHVSVSSIKLNFAKNDSLFRVYDQYGMFSINGGNQYQSTIPMPGPTNFQSAIFLAQGTNPKNILYQQNTFSQNFIRKTHDFNSNWAIIDSLEIETYFNVSQFAIDDSTVYYSKFIPGSQQEEVKAIYNNDSAAIINTVSRPVNEKIFMKGLWVENNDMYVSEVIHTGTEYRMLIKKSDNLVNPFNTIYQTIINNEIDSANTIPNSNSYFSLKVCGRHKFFSGVTNALFLLSTSIDSSFILSSGKVFFDHNNNSIFDTGDQQATGILIQSSTGVNTLSNNSGEYQYSVTSPNTVLSITPPSGYSCNPPQQTINPGNSNMNFALQASSTVADLSVFHKSTHQVMSQIFAIPIEIICKNEGNTPISGTLKFIIQSPSNYFLYNYTPYPNNISGDTLTWNLPVLGPQDTSLYKFMFEVDPNLPIGTIFNFESRVTSGTTNEINFANNHYSSQYEFGVLNDQTSKIANPTAYSFQQIQDNEYIHYFIFFRNYGPDNALHIQLTDTLSPLLEPSTFTFVSSSHPIFNATLSNQVLNVFYTGINLPDSVDFFLPNDYTGYYHFKIKPIASWTGPDTIYNKAYVTIDYLSTTQTNSTYTYQAFLTQNNSLQSGQINIFPNPASNFIMIEGLESNETLLMLDARGRQVGSLMVGEKNQVIKLPEIAPGLYFIKGTFGVRKIMIDNK